jgi:hypothetical protein
VRKRRIKVRARREKRGEAGRQAGRQDGDEMSVSLSDRREVMLDER